MSATVARSLVIAGLALVGGAATAHASTPLGVWIDHTGRGAVEIIECGNRLCGKIVWVKSKGHAEGCNIQVIGNARPVGGGKWDGGWVLDPEDNRKYDVELTPIGRDRLRVLGYLGMKMFGETMTWRRAPADLERCDRPKARAASSAAGTPTSPPMPPPTVAAAAAPADRAPLAVSAPTPNSLKMPNSVVAAAPVERSPAPAIARAVEPAVATPARDGAPVVGGTVPEPSGTAPSGTAPPAPEPRAGDGDEPATGGRRTGSGRGAERALVDAVGSLFEERKGKGGKRECRIAIPDFASLSFPC